jgi:hypothetical protein
MKATRVEIAVLLALLLVVCLAAWTMIFPQGNRPQAVGIQANEPDATVYVMDDGITVKAFGPMRHEKDSFHGIRGKSTMRPEFVISNASDKTRRVFIFAKGEAMTLMEYSFKLGSKTDFKFHLDPVGDSWQCTVGLLPENHP